MDNPDRKISAHEQVVGMTMSDDNKQADDSVRFEPGEVIAMIAYLANAVTTLGSSIVHLAADEKNDAVDKVKKAGEQVDRIIAIIQGKLS